MQLYPARTFYFSRLQVCTCLEILKTMKQHSSWATEVSQCNAQRIASRKNKMMYARNGGDVAAGEEDALGLGGQVRLVVT